jgi:hypothetical protein
MLLRRQVHVGQMRGEGEEGGEGGVEGHWQSCWALVYAM